MHSSLSWTDYKTWLKPLLVGPFPAFFGDSRFSGPSSDQSAPRPSVFVIDSRLIKGGHWFIPLPGSQVDGHDFIAQAMEEKGASGFLYNIAMQDRVPKKWLAKGVPVTDTVKALQTIALGWRNFLPQLTVFALTGSIGKTTCKEMLGRILAQEGKTLISKGNFNTEIGVPLTLLQLEPEHRYAVIEMGARHPGDIAELVQLANPDVTACLNARHAHLEIFKTHEAILNTKLEIITRSSSDCKAVVCHDDERLLTAARESGKDLLTFGRHPAANVRLNDVAWLSNDPKSGMKITLTLPSHEQIELCLPCAHEAYPINATAACAMAFAAGISPSSMVEAFRHFGGLSGRYRTFQNGKLTFIDDTYNASLDSMEAGLRSLSRSYPTQAKVVVLGDMLELGQDSEYAHRKLGSLCQSLVHPDLLITVGSRACQIGEQAVKDGMASEKILHYQDVHALLSDLASQKLDFSRYGEVLYAKASRGIQLNQLIARFEPVN